MKRQIPIFLVFLFGVIMLFQFFVPHEYSQEVYKYLLDWIIVIGIFAVAIGIWSLFKVAVEKVRNRKEGWQYSYVTLAGLFAMLIFGFTSRNVEGGEWGWFFVFVSAILLTVGMILQAMVDRKKSGLYGGAAVGFVIISIIIAIFDNAWAFHFGTAEGLSATMFVTFFDYILIPIFATMFSLLAFFIASAAYRAFRARNVMSSLLLIAALIVMLRFNPLLEPIFGMGLSKTSLWLMNVPNMAAQRAIIMGVGLGIVATALKGILGIERNYMGKG